MLPIPVFKAERDAGLEKSIRANARVCLASLVRSEKLDLSEKTVARLRSLAHQFAQAGGDDFDLHHLVTILVSVGWNKNDDVFDAVETWVARRTPEDKQLNYEHDDSKIVGHITSNWVVDAEGKVVPDETVVDDLPVKFHVATGAVLYKHWQTPELQKRVDELIAQIAKGEWYVSMECLFKGFDYALKASDGTARVVARNEKTAFLSKHLRCYGGTGEYGEYRVGRLLRNIVFSGKGLVRNPANPESVILTSEGESFSSRAAEYLTEFSGCIAEQVYSLPTRESATQQNQESQQVMTVTVEQLQAKLDAAIAENERLKASQTEAVIADIKAKLATAEADKAKAEEALKSAGETVKSAKDAADESVASAAKTVDAMKAELDEAKKSLAEAQDELKALHADKVKVARISLVKEKLGLDEAAAAEFVTDHASASEEAFAKTVEFIAKTIAAKTVKSAPKATEKPLAPKATNKPAPMAGKASEEDAAGEESAESTDLETAAAANDAALSTSVSDSGVTETQKAIAAAFGCEVESN